MSSNDYFDNADQTPFAAGSLARSAEVDAKFAAVTTGLDRLPTEVELKRGTISYAGSTTGSANAYIATLPYVPSGFVDGLYFEFKANHTNDGAATVNLNSLGVKSLRRQDGTALVSGDVVSGNTYSARYNTTSGYFELTHLSAGSLADVTVVSGIAADVTTVAGISANVTTVAGISANVTTVAGISANVTTVAGISANITTVAGISADVTAVVANESDISTAADNIAAIIAAPTSASDAAASADEAAASAANLPNATTAGANKFLQTDAAGTGWDYHTAADARTALGLGDAATKTVGVAAGNVVQVDQAETSVASATSITFATTLNQLLTGTTDVDTINSVAGRTNRIRVETGGFALNHSAGLNCLQTGAAITTAAGDTFKWFALTASTGFVFDYVRASGVGLKKIASYARNAANEGIPGHGLGVSTTQVIFTIPTPMRYLTAVTGISVSDPTHLTIGDGTTNIACTNVAFAAGGVGSVRITVTVAAGAAQYRPYLLYFNNAAGSLTFTGQTYD
jgi:hypothetical protein